MATLSELKQLAHQVREKEFDDPHGRCYPTSKSLKKELAKRTTAEKSDMDIEEVRMGSAGTIRHYVLSYPASEVEDSNASGRILIDTTLEQYCTEFEEAGKVETSIGPRENIPGVIIYETKAQAPYTG